MLLPDPFSQPKPNRKYWIIGAMVVLVLLGIGAKPGYRHFKNWRAAQLISQAETLIDGSKWSEALPKAQAAFQLNQNDPRTIRAMARILTRNGRDQGILYWQLLAYRSELTKDDRKQMIALALMHHRYDIARQPLDEALKDKPVDGDILRLAAEFADSQGDQQRAIAFARAALEKDTGNARLKLFIGTLQLHSGNELQIQEGKSVLWELGDGTEKDIAKEALVKLGEFPDLSASELTLIYQKLEALPNWGLAEDFTAADIQIRLHPERASLFVAKMIDRYQKGTPEQLVRLARWLNIRSGPAKTIDTIPLEAALKNRDLLLVYLDALSALKRWPEVDKILANEKTTLEPLLLELFRARAAKELGQDKAATLYWNQVQELARQQPAWLSYIGGYAEKNGELDEAKKAFKALSSDSRSARGGFAGLIRISERLGDTAQLKETLETMVKQFPEDPAPANDLTYVNLLLNESLVESEQKARAALEKNTNSFAARTTLALSCLRLNKLNDAKELYQKNPIDWANALPSWQAVYVSVLAATGQRHTALSLAQMIDARRLKPEEKDLIRKFVR